MILMRRVQQGWRLAKPTNRKHWNLASIRRRQFSTPMTKRIQARQYSKQRTKYFNEPITHKNDISKLRLLYIPFFREFDPGSGQTLAACLTHASRTECLRLRLRSISLVT